MQMSNDLLKQTLYALEARLRELNNRGSEPTGGDIASTHAALDVIRSLLISFGSPCKPA